MGYLTPTGELDAVNTMLTSIGESPVNSLLDLSTEDTIIARDTLGEISRDVQSKGWFFNTEDDYPLVPDVDGHINLAPTTLRVDVKRYSPRDVNVIQRGRRLYDKRRRTYVFKEPVKAEIVFLLPFDELPEPARRYITLKATRLFHDRTVGETTQHDIKLQDEIQAWADLRDQDTESGDFNFLHGDSVARVLRR